VSHTFANPAQWTEKAIINVANMGWFSSDRTIQDYANDCWQLPYVVK
jgi:starch phosphorylase